MNEVGLPVALFAFNRPWHLQQTVQSLLNNTLSRDVFLTVYCDGPRSSEDVESVSQVRDFVKKIEGFSGLKIVERDKNIGLANSIIMGVTEQCAQFGRIIVLEDDLCLSPYFLQYMKEALLFYQNEEKVISIHGYCYPVDLKLPHTFLLRGADCWGWATWKRGWDLFEKDGQTLSNRLRDRNLSKSFNMDNSTDYMQMLQNQISGKNNSWAIRWRASAFLEDKLTLYPGISLVQNMGHDNSGTHCGANDAWDTIVADQPIVIETIPVVENQEARAAYVRFYQSMQPPLWRRVASKVKRALFV